MYVNIFIIPKTEIFCFWYYENVYVHVGGQKNQVTLYDNLCCDISLRTMEQIFIYLFL